MESTGRVGSQELENQEIKNKEFIDFLITNSDGIAMSDEEIEEVVPETDVAYIYDGKTPEEAKDALRDWYADLCVENGIALVNIKKNLRKENLKNAFELFQRAFTIRDNPSLKSNDPLSRSSDLFLVDVCRCIGIVYYRALDYTNVDNEEIIYNLALKKYSKAIGILSIYKKFNCKSETKEFEKIKLEIEDLREYESELKEKYEEKRPRKSWCERLCSFFTGNKYTREGYKRVPSSDPSETQKLPDPVNDRQKQKLL